MLPRDIRSSPLYAEADRLYRAFRRPGEGRLSDAADLAVAPDGRSALFTGSLTDIDPAQTLSRIGRIDLETGEIRILTFGPNTDRAPKWSPDGERFAFLSDRADARNAQLYLYDMASGAARPTAPVAAGWVEYFHWSPKGDRILLGVAAHGADLSGAEGGLGSRTRGPALPDWMPDVESSADAHHWRTVWILDLSNNRVQPVSLPGRTVWEAAWCGNEAIAAITSASPEEGGWYFPTLELVQVASGESRTLYKPRDQLGWPAGAPDGGWLAIVEAVCSDRGLVAGNLKLIDTATGTVRAIDTQAIDVTHLEWCTPERLVIAGQRGVATAIALLDLKSGQFTERWASREKSTGGALTRVSAFGAAGDVGLIAEDFHNAPSIALIRDGRYHTIRSLELDTEASTSVLASAEAVRWRAPDGLEIEGWFLKPSAPATRHPVILQIHGGPVWLTRPTWLGRRSFSTLMLLQRGYAFFMPNPRGSSGYGQDFARRVVGDMGGKDARDLLSGLDALAERALIDPKRIGVSGGSYGGFMTSWLISHDTRFAAAIPVAPVNNYVTEHLLSNIPSWPKLFLTDPYHETGGQYYTRSPVMFAHRVKTPTLNICGVLDRSAPPEEAVQFHRALLEHGVESALVTYPQEGHGVRNYPAIIDYSARVVSWFETHV